jgi:hypothetical protein
MISIICVSFFWVANHRRAKKLSCFLIGSSGKQVNATDNRRRIDETKCARVSFLIELEPRQTSNMYTTLPFRIMAEPSDKACVIALALPRAHLVFRILDHDMEDEEYTTVNVGKPVVFLTCIRKKYCIGVCTRVERVVRSLKVIRRIVDTNDFVQIEHVADDDHTAKFFVGIDASWFLI